MIISKTLVDTKKSDRNIGKFRRTVCRSCDIIKSCFDIKVFRTRSTKCCNSTITTTYIKTKNPIGTILGKSYCIFIIILLIAGKWRCPIGTFCLGGIARMPLLKKVRPQPGSGVCNSTYYLETFDPSGVGQKFATTRPARRR